MTYRLAYCTNEEPPVYSDGQDEVTGWSVWSFRSIWSVWFVWLNQIDQTDLCHQIDPIKSRSCA
jgi:hypothetical protein